MRLDPIDYDVTELRKLARLRDGRYLVDGFLWVELPADAVEDDIATPDRPSEWSGALDDREKPYLRELPDGEAARSIARRWVERLVEEAGVGGAADALAYYESLGWITEAVESELSDLLLGAGNNPDADGGRAAVDHVDSLARVIALAELPGNDG